MEALVKRWQRSGPKTAAANTAYVVLLESQDSGRVIVNRLSILNQGTAQTLSVMQVLGRSKLAANALAAQAVVKLANAEVTRLGLVNGDWLAIRLIDGSYHVNTVTVGAADSGGAGFTNITFASTLPKAAETGGRVFFFDVPASHEQVAIPVSSTTTWESDYGYFGANEIGDPLLLHVNNPTAASTLQACVCPVIAV